MSRDLFKEFIIQKKNEILNNPEKEYIFKGPSFGVFHYIIYSENLKKITSCRYHTNTTYRHNKILDVKKLSNLLYNIYKSNSKEYDNDFLTQELLDMF